MLSSHDQYNLIIKEFSKTDSGYSKMGRCVTSIRPRSEAEMLGVRVGWLEKFMKRVIPSKH